MSYLNRRKNSEEIYVDLDISAFHVEADEVEDVANYLAAAIMTRSMIEFGEVPTEF